MITNEDETDTHLHMTPTITTVANTLGLTVETRLYPSRRVLFVRYGEQHLATVKWVADGVVIGVATGGYVTLDDARRRARALAISIGTAEEWQKQRMPEAKGTT